MRIGEYTLVSRCEGHLLGTRDGRLYRLQPCPEELNDHRAAAIARALGECVLPDTNILLPDFFEADTGWFTAVPYREDVFLGLPPAYLRCLPDKARRHMLLLAASALEVLSRGHVVHGSLNPDCFRLTVSEVGVLCLVLEDLRPAGTAAYPPIRPDRSSPFASPEARIGKPPTTASDMFALGLCMHFWLTGELPRNRQELPAAPTRKVVWISDAVPVWARSVLLSMLEANPAARPKPQDVLKRLREGTEACTDDLYASSELPAEDLAEMRQLLLQEHPLLLDRYAE